MKSVVRNEIGITSFPNISDGSFYKLYRSNAKFLFLNEMSDHSKTLQKHFIFIQRHRVSAIADQRN